MPGAEPTAKSAGDAADGKPFDRGPQIARSGRRALRREDIKLGEILIVHQRPAHSLVSDHAERFALDGVAREALKHATARRESHRRMNDDASDFSGLNNSRELRPL